MICIKPSVYHNKEIDFTQLDGPPRELYDKTKIGLPQSVPPAMEAGLIKKADDY